MSSDKEDCGLGLALDGRAVDMASPLTTAAMGGAEISAWTRLALPAAKTPPTVARQACTGAIVHRRYSQESVAELRAGLRRVTI